MAMMAMTTSSSMSVNAARFFMSGYVSCGGRWREAAVMAARSELGEEELSMA